MIYEYELKTVRECMINITASVKDALKQSRIQEGICVIYCPHTTAGITINENADPAVIKDVLLGFDKAYPNRKEFLHSEGNSTAHLKSSCVGVSQTVIIKEGKPLLGVWQSIYFCEFDGPRTRKFYVKTAEI